jgi:hypothetical protein
MRPVMMESLTSDTEAYRACLASLLQIELDEFPAFQGLAATMQWNAWLASELNLYVLRFEFGTIATPPGMWLATMASPYQGYDLHAVVCAGSRVVHDPHPEAQPGADYLNLATVELLIPLDPGEQSGRFTHH